uniref:Pyrin domain-containing protein n=1 Tax=Cyprinus carpio TaxID=7962 RepID=A0A8C2Q0R2_CYPCA
ITSDYNQKWKQLLADLDTDKLKRFKWLLKNYYSVSATDLEKADAPDTVDLMIKRFGPEEVVKITMDILRKMNQNHVAEELEKKHKQGNMLHERFQNKCTVCFELKLLMCLCGLMSLYVHSDMVLSHSSG